MDFVLRHVLVSPERAEVLSPIRSMQAFGLDRLGAWCWAGYLD